VTDRENFVALAVASAKSNSLATINNACKARPLCLGKGKQKPAKTGYAAAAKAIAGDITNRGNLSKAWLTKTVTEKMSISAHVKPKLMKILVCLKAAIFPSSNL
jgi:hypothetical protein